MTDASKPAVDTSAERDRLREGHRENARLLALVINDLQGRVEAGKIIALQQCLERSRAALETSAKEG